MPKITAKNIFVCCKQNEKVAINKRYHLLIKTKLHKERYPASWFFPHALKNRAHRNLSPLFALSESLRSVFFLYLLFLSHSEACFFSICSFWVTQKRVFFSICPFWVAQKRVFSLFALSESLRSTYFLFLLFLSRSEACFFSICLFWVTQKHVFLFFDSSYIVCNTKILFFMLHTSYVTPKFPFFRFIQCM